MDSGVLVGKSEVKDKKAERADTIMSLINEQVQNVKSWGKMKMEDRIRGLQKKAMRLKFCAKAVQN